MWQHVFRSGSWIIYFHILFSQLRTWFIFCVFSYVVIIHLLRIGGDISIYCKFIPYWIESTQAQLNQMDPSMNIISCLIQSGIQEPNSNYYLEKYFNISSSNHPPCSLIATASLVFSPIVFPITYPPISQTSSTQIKCWTHWFHKITCHARILIPVINLISLMETRYNTGSL